MTTAVRRTDPATSHEAVRLNSPRWGSMNGLALSIFYDHRDNPDGLTCWEVELLAVHDLSGQTLGKCPWKRTGELHTSPRYRDNPLIAHVLTPDGVEVTRPGEDGVTPREAWRITDAGIYAYWRMRSAQL